MEESMILGMGDAVEESVEVSEDEVELTTPANSRRTNTSSMKSPCSIWSMRCKGCCHVIPESAWSKSFLIISRSALV